ncbi:hypothetical protein C8R43DRAFT_963528 [Mycena crocata]|nr:hypothetical protein C8R43DRAFT_963528 [Mycena crocata]
MSPPKLNSLLTSIPEEEDPSPLPYYYTTAERQDVSLPVHDEPTNPVCQTSEFYGFSSNHDDPSDFMTSTIAYGLHAPNMHSPYSYDPSFDFEPQRRTAEEQLRYSLARLDSPIDRSISSMAVSGSPTNETFEDIDSPPILDFSMFEVPTLTDASAALASLLASCDYTTPWEIAGHAHDIPSSLYSEHKPPQIYPGYDQKLFISTFRHDDLPSASRRALAKANQHRGVHYTIHVEEASLGIMQNYGGIPFFHLVSRPQRPIEAGTILLCYGGECGVWRVEYELFREEGDVHCRVSNDEEKVYMVLRIPPQHVNFLSYEDRLRRMLSHADQRTAQILDTQVIADTLAKTHLHNTRH